MSEFFGLLARYLEPYAWSQTYGPVSLLLSMLVNTCSLPYNDEVAHLSSAESGYLLEVSGRRVPMVHDPFSAVFAGTLAVSAHYRIPRNSGRIAGSEVSLVRASSTFHGFIEIAGDRVIIDLRYRGSDDHEDAVGWSGEYRLEPMR